MRLMAIESCFKVYLAVFIGSGRKSVTEIMKFLARPYRWRISLATRAIVALLLCFGASVVLSCGASPEEIKARRALDGPSDPEILYNAILQEFRAREIPIEIASEDYLLVSGEFEPINDQVRRRYIARVIVLRNGAALNVEADFQRRTTEGAAQVWMDSTEQSVRRRAKQEEKMLGEAIRDRFASLKN